jgi:catalase
VPDRSPAAVETRADLEPSPALSILVNGPQRFAGRKLGVLVSDGFDADLLQQLLDAATAEESLVDLVAPRVGSVTTADDDVVTADQKIGGGPSVLYDAVVLLPGDATVGDLANDVAVRDFVADAYAHCKFIGFVAAAEPLLVAAGVRSDVDHGFVALEEEGASAFLERCGALRFWDRELLVTTARP